MNKFIAVVIFSLSFFLLLNLIVFPQEFPELEKIENLYNEGIRLYGNNELDPALEKFKAALAKSREIGIKKLYPVLTWFIAKIWESKKEFMLAVEQYEESLRISRELGNKQSEASALSSLGRVYSLDLGYSFKALVFYKEALNIYRERNYKFDEISESFALGFIGWIYLRIADYSNALNYFKQNLELSRECRWS